MNVQQESFYSILKQACCPECDAALAYEAEPRIGEILVCSDCNTRLTVIRTAPLALDWAYLEPLTESETPVAREARRKT